MTRHGKKKPKKKQNRFEKLSPTDMVVDRLDSLIDVMLAVLQCSSCPACSGTGRAVVSTDQEGKPVFDRCSCRLRASSLLDEFEVEREPERHEVGGQEPEPSPEVEPSEKFTP